MRLYVLGAGVLGAFLAACGGGGDDDSAGDPTGLQRSSASSPTERPAVTPLADWSDVAGLVDAAEACALQENTIVEDWEENKLNWVTPAIDEDPDDYQQRVAAMNSATVNLEESLTVIAEWITENVPPADAVRIFTGFMDPDWSYLMYTCVAAVVSLD